MFTSEILTAILLLVNIGISRCSILFRPDNKAVVVGQRMEMECRTTNGSTVREWTRERYSGKGTDSLFINWGTSKAESNSKFPQFGVNVDATGSCILYSNSTDLEDAGIYTCAVQDNANKLLRYSAHLIALESTPVCEANLTADENGSLINIWLQCSVHFRGGRSPSVMWFYHDRDGMTRGNGTVFKDGVRTLIVPNSTITSTLETVVHSTKSVYSVYCQIYFIQPNGSITVNFSVTYTPSYHSYEYKSRPTDHHVGADLQSTMPAKWSEVSGMSTAIFPLSTHIVSENGKYSFLLWIVAIMAIIIFVMAITAIVCFFRFRSNKAESRLRVAVASSSESHGNIESLQHSDETLPYATSDHYDKIEELNISDESTTGSPGISPPIRAGVLPSPGYSNLNSEAQIVPPSVYCRMNSQEAVQEESVLGKECPVLAYVNCGVEIEACLGKGVLQSDDREANCNRENTAIYLTSIDDLKETRCENVDHSYLELSE